MQREKPILYLLTHVTNKLFCLGGVSQEATVTD